MSFSMTLDFRRKFVKRLDEQERLLDNFANAIREEFGFLDDYGFVAKDLEIVDFEYPRDKRARIDYVSNHLCVRIEWCLIDSTIGIGLIEAENGQVPDKYSYFAKAGFARAISLASLVEFLTHGTLENPLRDVGAKEGAREIIKAWRKREELIKQDMKGILAIYASWLKEYARDILNGDTSIFGLVQEYEKERVSEAYYP